MIAPEITSPRVVLWPTGSVIVRQHAQVAWYRANGRWPAERIKREYRGQGNEYVVGDWSWHRLHPEYRMKEWIEPLMNHDLSLSPNAADHARPLGAVACGRLLGAEPRPSKNK